MPLYWDSKKRATVHELAPSDFLSKLQHGLHTTETPHHFYKTDHWWGNQGPTKWSTSSNRPFCCRTGRLENHTVETVPNHCPYPMPCPYGINHCNIRHNHFRRRHRRQKLKMCLSPLLFSEKPPQDKVPSNTHTALHYVHQYARGEIAMDVESTRWPLQSTYLNHSPPKTKNSTPDTWWSTTAPSNQTVRQRANYPGNRPAVWTPATPCSRNTRCQGQQDGDLCFF